MEGNWKRIFAVAVLTALLPQLILYAGSKWYSGNLEPDGTLPTQPTAAPTQPAPQQITLPVLMDEGVVHMELETYIRGVVLAEMRASFGVEALKAQAVAARTYALRRVQLRDRHDGGAVCTDPGCCQAWMSDEDYLAGRGTREHWQKVYGAVESTAGTVLTYGGKAAECTYFSCSGGRTESALAVWGSEIPYLLSVESPGEESASAFSTQTVYSRSEFCALLDRQLEGEMTEWFGPITRTEGGGVQTVSIGGITYSGTRLRSLLGLASTAFTVDTAEEMVYITCRGHGHRVGMSQYGAGAMASCGSSWEQILAHYYPGTRIDKIEQIG